MDMLLCSQESLGPHLPKNSGQLLKNNQRLYNAFLYSINKGIDWKFNSFASVWASGFCYKGLVVQLYLRSYGITLQLINWIDMQNNIYHKPVMFLGPFMSLSATLLKLMHALR